MVPDPMSAKERQPVTIVDLRCQVPAGVQAIGGEPVRLTWRVSPAVDGVHQTGYRIEASSSPRFDAIVGDSGDLASDEQVAITAPGPALVSREVRWYRVRIATEGGWSDWSPTLRVKAGLLDASDWAALAVTLPGDPGSDAPSPAPMLRREFSLPASPASAELHVTSLGLHQVSINGRPVTHDLLAPGWTSYRHRLIAETYDVQPLLVEGVNVIVATLGDGWYRGRLGWDRGNDRCRYGREVGLVAQLEMEMEGGATQRVVTDERWLATTGEVISADLYDGCDIDLRARHEAVHRPGFDTTAWHPVAIVPFDAGIIEPRVAPPVRRVAVIAVQSQSRPDGTILLDGGQNIAGFVRLTVRGRPGDTVTVRHAEVLEPDGSLHVKSLRFAKATDTYVLADGDVTELEPVFTFHGFRYAEIRTSVQVLSAEFVVISSDTPRRGWFACSDARLNRLHENVVWSQRDNFVSVPTDCPQRDERLGWTGDAQAFAATASTLFDCQAFWMSWLRDLALDQDDTLGVPSVVPDVVLQGELRLGRAGWADAATIVPRDVHIAYGDRHILRVQLDSMRRWVRSLQAREQGDGLIAPGEQFGDWLDPDAPVDRPWQAKTDPGYLANAYYSWSARIAAEVADLMGDHAWAADARLTADRVASATWARWADHARTTQTGCAVALRLAIAPAAERDAVGDTLAQLVRAVGGRVATGFLGTPLILPALSDAGRIDEAYLMLLRREMPSWLYQVDQGATTMWERWDAILPDGSIHSGAMTTPPGQATAKDREAHMLSFNHYGYGAVIDWVYRHVGGIAPVASGPGYRRVTFAPKPVVGIDWARASIDSPYGPVGIDWRMDEVGDLVADLDLPFGASGEMDAPVTPASTITLDGRPCDGWPQIGPGRHRVVVTSPRIAKPDVGSGPTA